MTSNINPAYPVYGTPKTANVRANFQAAKDEIEALQIGKIPNPPIQAKTADYTLDGTEPQGVALRFNTSGQALTLTIPDGAGVNQRTLFFVHRDGSSNVTVKTSGADTINGQPSFTLSSDHETVALYKVSDGKWYALPINAGGSEGVNASPGDILTVDNAGKIVSSGSFVTEDGSVKSGSPNSLFLQDAHSISSAVQNIFFQNLADSLYYHPVWALANQTGDAEVTARIYADQTVSDYTIGQLTSSVITNPDFTLTAQENRRLWSMTVHPANTVSGVMLDIYIGSTRMWSHMIGDAVADQVLQVDFFGITSPMDFLSGKDYRFVVYSEEGDVQLYGGDGSGAPYILFKQRIFRDVSILHDDDRVKSIIAHPDKTATLTFTDGSTMIFDARPWFGQPTPTEHDIYVGWYDQAAKTAPTEGEIKGGTQYPTVTDIFGRDFPLAASGAAGMTNPRAFIAFPTVSGNPSAVSLGFFAEKWPKAQLEIDGLQYFVFYTEAPLSPADITIKFVK